MAYHIEGSNRPVVYCANPRTGSTATGVTILNMGGYSDGQHHCPPVQVPENAIVAQTIRHHCDVIVSFWYKGGAGVPLEEYVDLILSGGHHYLGAHAFYKTFDAPYLLRYETLQFEFDTLCEIAGIKCTTLTVAPTKRPKGMKWRNLFTTNLFNKVYSRYAEEMETLGYGCR